MKKKLLMVASVLIGLILFVGIIYNVGLSQILAALQEAGLLGLLSFLGLITIQILFFTLAWKVLLKEAGYDPPLSIVGICQIMGYTGNIITPSMYLGGEPVAAYFLAQKMKYPTRNVMGTMVTSKVVQLFAFLVILFAGSIVYLVEFAHHLDHAYTTILFWVDISAAAFACLLVYLFFKGKHVLAGFIRFVARMGIFPRTLLRLKPKVRGMEKTIHNVFQNSWNTLFLAFAFSMGAMMVIYLRPIVYLYFIPEAQMTLLAAAAFFTLSQLVQMLQFTPGGLGIFDLASVFIFYNVFNVKKSFAMSFNLGYRIADAVIVALGTAFIVHYGALIFLWEPSKIEKSVVE